jgi:hypothetical protein
MTLYNTLLLDSVCPCCRERTTIKIQFRYGEVWDYIYFIGDEIKWGDGGAGEPGRKLVVLDGVSEACDMCEETADFLIFVENDIIKTIRQNQGEYQFFGDDGFLVLEP